MRSLPSLAALLLLLAAPAAHAGQGVAWFKGSFDEALKSAKAQKKRLLIDVYATWCGPCHALDAKVFSRPDVASSLAPLYVALKIDGERGEGPALQQRFHTVGFPTVLFVDPEGVEIDRVFGEQPAEEFLKNALQWAKGEGTLPKVEEAYFTGHLFDAAYAADLSERWAVKGDLDRAWFYRGEVARIVHTLEEARFPETPSAEFARFLPEGQRLRASGLERARADAKTALRQAEFTFAKYGLLRGAKDYAKAAAMLTEIQQRYPGSDEADEAPFQLAMARHGLGDDTAAKSALDGYLKSHEKDAGAYNAYAWFCFKQGVFVHEGIAAAKTGLQLAPKDDGLWDTLAELQFQAGQATDAVASEKAALALKPHDAYYESQIGKFAAKK